MSTTENLRVMIVAPGAIYSTYDVFRYYRNAFERASGVEWVKGWLYHNLISYHYHAFDSVRNETGLDLGDKAEILAKAARDLLIDVIVEKPDVILFIDGSMMPPTLFDELRRLRSELHREFVIATYITEAPYTDEVNGRIAKSCDVVFVNDLYTAQRMNPDGNKFVHYLPHSYCKDVHRPGPVLEQYRSQVFFVGTGFPERVELLAAVDWTGIDLKLKGKWFTSPDAKVPLSEDGALLGILEPYIEDVVYSNEEVAQFYRSADIVLNIHRSTGWSQTYELSRIDPDSAYSVNPRALEAAACGAFQLSDPRPEILELFGDCVPTYRDAGELEQLVRRYVDDEESRHNMAECAMQKVRGMSYDDRVPTMLDIFREALTIRQNLGGN